MTIFSWNVNGLRSVCRHDFLGWVKRSNADIICLQEIKLQEAQIPIDIAHLASYHTYFSFAEKKGYSGVAVFTKNKPLRVSHELGLQRFDNEGRFLRLEFPDFILLNLYMPHGGRLKEKLTYKLACYQRLFEYLHASGNKPMILMGDFNIAHTELDLARPQGNKDNIMFTPKERQQLDQLIGMGFVDSFRQQHLDENGHYSWWPYGFEARSRNIGWRIDYAFVSTALASKIKNTSISTEVLGSDHCPVGVRV
jgi:exodeoxyribonuclease III